MIDASSPPQIATGLGQAALGFALLLGQWHGLGAPVIARWRGPAAERLALGLLAGVFASYLIAFGVYLLGLDAAWHRLAPLVALLLLAWQRREIAAFYADPAARAALWAWLLFAAWLLGWLALVRVYWGGGWMGDWVEHYERARFFLDDAPLETRFHTRCGLTARPPLWNLVMAGWLGVSGGAFSACQIGSALGSSLILPAAWAVLARFDASARVGWRLAAMLLASAPVLQNAAFPWTKLPAAAFLLCAVPLLVEASRTASARHLAIGFALLAAGVLVHYSIAPYLLVSIGAGLWAARGHWRGSALWRAAALAAALSGAVLLTWVAWAVYAYGPARAFLDNTAVSDRAALGPVDQIGRALANLFHTVVPHFLRPAPWKDYEQSWFWSSLRDRGFLLYQTNLWFAIGSAGAPLVLWSVARGWLRPAAPWLAWLGGAVVLGVAAHGGADAWGLAHIGLLPVVVLALAALALVWPRLPPAARVLGVLGAVFDFAWGALLHFALQHRDPAAWFGAAPELWPTVLRFGPSSFQNAWDKERFGFVFLGDHLTPLAPLIVIALAGVAVLVLRQARNPPS